MNARVIVAVILVIIAVDIGFLKITGQPSVRNPDRAIGVLIECFLIDAAGCAVWRKSGGVPPIELTEVSPRL